MLLIVANFAPSGNARRLAHVLHQTNPRSMHRLSAIVLLTSSLTASAQTINQSGFSFNPNLITVQAGATITFQIGSPHDATEVSQTTWNASGTTPLPGGFFFGAGTNSFQPTVGTHYYLCSVHPSTMKGRIIVDPNTGVSDEGGKEVAIVFPNPAGSELVLGESSAGRVAVLIDAEGREAYRLAVAANARLDVSSVSAGSYTLRVLDGQGALHTAQRVVIMR